MASRVVMPKLSDTMEEGKILRWLKKEGDKVETGQTLAEVETDKATVEMEAYTNGVVRKLIAKEGDTIPIGAMIAVIGSPDEDISALVEAGGVRAGTPAPAAAPPPQAQAPAPREAPRPAPPRRPAPPPAPATQAEAPGAEGGRGLRASPLALRMAADAGIDIGTLKGTGPQGRIIRRDIEAALEQAKAPAAAPPPAQPIGEVQEIELSSMRRTIARRLVQSKAPVPHFYLTVDVRMERAWEAYKALRDENYPVSLNDVVVKATASALRRHPEMNASFAGDRVRQYTRVHIGIAVALEDGLITPVIRDADSKSLLDIAQEARELAERARARRLQPHEYTGGTFSISNLGMMGIEEFSAIINPPEAGILAVGAVREVPVVEGGEVRVGRRMKLTLSVDHRVADGAQGARFLQTLTRMLENPLLIG
ncbi:MAG: pyruvate dehydrogenase complex dihydrolipoamide acetyltransferase [Acidobacteria bacterium]|jgi:pyruvate dehydrogenase E2 component (dihydrolipoamide acetyltransferase)|nr:pyruvate dehydrogenase complex dihydrolipoamide acetyltransferase [Acidobacteriota bacterium]